MEYISMKMVSNMRMFTKNIATDNAIQVLIY